MVLAEKDIWRIWKSCRFLIVYQRVPRHKEVTVQLFSYKELTLICDAEFLNQIAFSMIENDREEHKMNWIPMSEENASLKEIGEFKIYTTCTFSLKQHNVFFKKTCFNRIFSSNKSTELNIQCAQNANWFSVLCDLNWRWQDSVETWF